jgi:putative transposase
MPRRDRCVLPEVPCHITQRGVDRRETFSSNEDYVTYLRLLRGNLRDAGVSVLAYCLMRNHVHLIALPAREDSLAILLRRVHGRYAQYYNARTDRTGHLWQNRYFACVLGERHLWAAMAYVEQNPVRAGIIGTAAAYPWSSAAAHIAGIDPSGILDMAWRAQGQDDCAAVAGAEDAESVEDLRRCTYAGRPFGEPEFVTEVGRRFDRHWERGRPRKQRVAIRGAQLAMFQDGSD